MDTGAGRRIRHPSRDRRIPRPTGSADADMVEGETAGEAAREETVRAEAARRARWAARCAALPPMTAEEVASTARVHRRIDARRHARGD